MGLLADLLELLFVPGSGPESPRGWLIVSLVYGIMLTGVLAYTLATGPSQSDTAAILAFLGAPLGIFFATLHFIREPTDRRLSLSAIVGNAVAATLALALTL